MTEQAAPPYHRASAALRGLREMSKKELAAQLKVTPETVASYELKRTLGREEAERITRAMGFRPAMLDRAVAFVQAGRSDLAALRGPLTPAEMIARRIEAIVEEAAQAKADSKRAEVLRLLEETEILDALRRAPLDWARLRRYPAPERRAIVEEGEEMRNWALVPLLCDESEKAAPDSAARAQEIAELALWIAERVPGEESWRRECRGYALAFLGNALRVGGSLPKADAAFTQSRQLWGESGGRGLLDGVRLLDLEASLRREQRRFFDAHTLLDRALEARPMGEAAGRFLMKKAKVYEENGEYDLAVEKLRQAESLVEAGRDPRLLWGLRFNVLVNLVHAKRYTDAQALLPGIRDLAIELGNGLDLVRLRWLEARLLAGLEYPDEAIAMLAEVQSGFAARGIAYDAALAALERGVLLAEGHRTAEAKNLVRESLPIFQTQRVGRETLVTLQLFIQAAETETLTVDLARRALAELQAAGPPPVDSSSGRLHR